MKKKRSRNMIIVWILGIILALILVLFLVRFVNPREIDDVTPGIKCDEGLLKKADVLWVIPKFEGKNISDDKEWCSGILGMNKKLGLHGVYHTYREFGVDRSEGYLNEGISEFEKCFGRKPGEFKAPQLYISGNNVKMVKSSGLKVRGFWNQWTHKVYHCSDTGQFPNWLIDIF